MEGWRDEEKKVNEKKLCKGMGESYNFADYC